MNAFLRLFAYILLLGLSSCASQHKNFINTQGLNQCQKVCIQHLEYCKQHCTNNCPKCTLSATNTAASNYLKYLHELQVQGGYVTRNLNSYRDPLQCRKVTCDCAADFDTCNQGCTGIIQKRLQTVPYCT